MNSIRFLPAWAMALTLVLLQPPASADERHRPHSRLDVDFDSLKAELFRVEGEWLLEVRYEVEIEDYNPGDRFELIFYVAQRKQVLLDDERRRIEYVIPLDNPTDVDDDELEFEQQVTLTLPEGAFRNPRRLKLHALVVYQGQHEALKHKDRSIKFKRPHSRRQHYRDFRLGVVAPRCDVRIGARW